MPYTKTIWVNGSTPAINEDNLNKIENGIEGAFNASEFNTTAIETLTKQVGGKVAENTKDIAGILLNREIDGLTPSLTTSKYMETPTIKPSNSLGLIDATKAYCASVTQGSSSATISSMLVGIITDFKSGQEVTIQSSAGKESIIVNTAVGSTITFKSNISLAHTGVVNIYRSNIESSGETWKVGAIENLYLVDRKTVGVISKGESNITFEDTATAPDGTLYVMYYFLHGTYSFSHIVLKSTDNGATWVNTNFPMSAGAVYRASLEVDSLGKVHVAHEYGASAYLYYTTLTGSTWSTPLLMYSNSPTLVILSIDKSDNIHISWTDSLQTTVRYQKYTKSTSSWGTVTTIAPASTYVFFTHKILFNSVGDVFLLTYFSESVGQLDSIKVYISRSGGAFYSVDIMPLRNSNLDDLSGCFDTDDTLHVASVISTYTDSDPQTVYFKMSSSEVVTSGVSLSTPNYNNNTCDIIVDKYNVIHIVFSQDSSTSSTSNRDIYWIKCVDGVWGTKLLLVGTPTDSQDTPIFFKMLNFVYPVFAWESGTTVSFYGEWYAGTSVDVTDVDVRMNITPPKNVENIVSWLFGNGLGTITGKVSIVGTSDNESYITMDKETTTLTGETETFFNQNGLTPNSKVTAKFNITRPTTVTNVLLYRILGGVDGVN